MAKPRDYKREDRHRNSKGYGLRIDGELLELFRAKTEKEGRSMRSILIKAIEDYVFGNGDE